MEIAPHSPLQGQSAAGTSSAGSITSSPAGQRIDPGHGSSQARVAPPLHAPVRRVGTFIRPWSGALPGSQALRSLLAMLGNSVGQQLLSAHSGTRDGAGLGRPPLARGEATSVNTAAKRFPQLQVSTSTSTGHLHVAHVMKSMVQALNEELGPRSREALRPGAHDAVIAARLGARTARSLIEMLKARSPQRRT